MLNITVHLVRHLLPISLVVLICWVIGLYIYRLTLHPLARFPGPKVAAVSRWYEFYYDVILQGRYVFRLQELHVKYGPIIRISPEELHINDPDFFDTLYARSGRLHKHVRDSDRFGNRNSVFVTADANVHRGRRAALNPFFSRRNVVSFQNFVHAKVNQLLNKIKTYQETGEPLTISLGYMALTGDVIMEYCFGYNYDHVASEGFATNFHEVLLTASQSGNLAVHFPIVMRIIMSMPEWFVVWGTPLFALLFKLRRSAEEDVKKFKEDEKREDDMHESERSNVIQYLIRSDLPAEEKADQRLTDEAQNFIGAGVSTTGWVLTVATFHIIKNPLIYKRLRRELEQVISDPDAPNALEWSKLEKCEYLTACLKEGIRLAYAVSGRLVRLSDVPLVYGNWSIPPMTPISMTMVDLSHNEDIFAESNMFKPERWLDNTRTADGELVEKYWFGFGRGNRNCLGIHLAWLELYMTIAGVFRSFKYELFETDESDIVLKHDFMIPVAKLDSKGVRVLVKD